MKLVWRWLESLSASLAQPNTARPVKRRPSARKSPRHGRSRRMVKQQFGDPGFPQTGTRTQTSRTLPTDPESVFQGRVLVFLYSSSAAKRQAPLSWNFLFDLGSGTIVHPPRVRSRVFPEFTRRS